MGGANLQCVKNHHAKLKYIGMNTFGVTQIRHPLSILDGKMSKFNTHQK